MQQKLVDALPKLLEFFGLSSEFEAHLKDFLKHNLASGAEGGTQWSTY